jgi:competence protein ComEC
LEFGARAILITGDVEMKGERGMLQTGENLRADVIKVAHHGSRTSSTDPFIAAVQPCLAVISVGQTSIFGHPSEDVVVSWRNSGAEVLTTGKSGTITITTDGQTLELETFVKNE